MQNEVNELRNQVRALRRLLLAVIVLVGFGGLLASTGAQEVPDVIQAKRFEVVNDEGKVFVLISGSTTQPNTIKSHQDGGIISTYGSRGETLILMGMNDRGSGAIQTRNNKGKTLVSIGTNPSGGGTVFTEDGRGERSDDTRGIETFRCLDRRASRRWTADARGRRRARPCGA